MFNLKLEPKIIFRADTLCVSVVCHKPGSTRTQQQHSTICHDLTEDLLNVSGQFAKLYCQCCVIWK